MSYAASAPPTTPPWCASSATSRHGSRASIGECGSTVAGGRDHAELLHKAVNRPIGAHSAECSYRTFKSDRCALRALRSCAFRSALRHQPSRVPEASLPWIRCVHGLSWTLVPSRSAGTPTELSGTTHGRQSVKHLLKPKEEKSG